MYDITVHNETMPSFIAKEITPKYEPLERDFTVVNQVKKATANARILGVANESAIAGEMIGVDNRKFVIGKIGTGGVSAGDNLKTDGAGGFVTGTAGTDVIVAIAQTAGAEGKYIEIELLPASVIQVSVARGDITGTLSDQTDLQDALDLKADVTP